MLPPTSSQQTVAMRNLSDCCYSCRLLTLLFRYRSSSSPTTTGSFSPISSRILAEEKLRAEDIKECLKAMLFQAWHPRTQLEKVCFIFSGERKNVCTHRRYIGYEYLFSSYASMFVAGSLRINFCLR